MSTLCFAFQGGTLCGTMIVQQGQDKNTAKAYQWLRGREFR